MFQIAVAATLFFSDVCPQVLQDHYYTECALSSSERELLIRQAEYAYIRSMQYMDLATNECSKILDIDAREACKTVLQAAIMSLAGSGSKEKCLIAALTVIGRYADKSYEHAIDAYDYLVEAFIYAAHGDDLQEQLWRD